jgi:hypothetical protein
MTSAFADAWSRAAPDIDARFGSLFLYQPMAPDPLGGRPIPDPGRAAPAAPIVGALGEVPVFAYPDTRSRKQSTVAQESQQDSSIDIATAALPYAPRDGDRLTDCDTGAVYQVAGLAPDGIARIQLRVIKLKS